MQRKKYYIVYKTTNIKNDMIYIGAHSTNNLHDKYIGSGTNLIKAKRKFGRLNFKREILKTFTNETDMYKYERELVNEEFVSRSDVYNIKLGGEYS
jgi:hypothetical protein